MKREIYDPASDGFGFSNQELNQILDRKARLTEARFFQKNAWNRKTSYPKAA